MEETQDDGKPFKTYHHEEIEKHELQIEYIRKYSEDLTQNIKYQEFFTQYSENSVNEFIKAYATSKANFMLYGPIHKKNAEESFLRFKEEAEEYFWHIQQKKLFDLQCLWRAEKIEIKEIEASCDFYIWSMDIKKCPFLDPVSEEDLELYTDFLLNEGIEDEIFPREWQQYDFLKQDYLENSIEASLPDWYIYYDNRKGTGSLLLLPNTRGEKEDFYLDLCQAREIKDDKTQLEPVDLGKPYLAAYDDKVTEEFIRRFESKDVLANYLENKKFNSEINESDEIEYFLEVLKQSEDNFPIEANENWKEGLKIAAEKCRVGLIIKALRIVYDEYVFRMEHNISFEEDDADRTHIETMKKIYQENFKEKILAGRELNGEPRDFNF